MADEGMRAGASGRRGLMVRPMAEGDIRAVMPMEIASFPDPWTPLAYALELGSNPCAHYTVAEDEAGEVAGCMGWWETPRGASITHVVVAPERRREGVGRALMDEAFARAVEAGCDCALLEVRAQNEGARAFYARMGFQEVEVMEGYYSGPKDDAVVMAASLG